MFDWVLKTYLYFPGLSFQSISAPSKDLFSKYSFDWQVNKEVGKSKSLKLLSFKSVTGKVLQLWFHILFNTDVICMTNYI